MTPRIAFIPTSLLPLAWALATPALADPASVPRPWASHAACDCYVRRSVCRSVCRSVRPRAPRWYLELEGAAIWQTRNDVQSPGTTGTRFALDEVTGAGPYLGGRVQLDYQAWRRHGFRLIVAPLQFSGTGTFDEPVDFEGQTFAAGTATEGTYRFNSYRLGYRFTLFSNRVWTWRIGATAKIRDAMVELSQGSRTARKTDLGFVPPLHVDGEMRLAPRWKLVADLDALAGGPGRAIDFALKLCYQITCGADIAVGYRTIEGGADVDEVYSFAWLHQAVVTFGYRF